MNYRIDSLESADNPLVLFRGIVGSRAYGTQNANSDYDVRGVYVRPLDWYLQLKDDPQDTIVEALPDEIDVSLWEATGTVPCETASV